jgi:GntR family transcriptional regulator/MocR family aminotransferase
MLPSTTVQLGSISIRRGEQETIVHQLSRQIREMILSGKLAIGTRIPSTRELGDELRVSRTTVRESYEQLVAESYLSSSVGKGTFVIDHPLLRVPPGEQAELAQASDRPESLSEPISTERLSPGRFSDVGAG